MKSHKQFSYLNISIFNSEIKHGIQVNARDIIHFDMCIREPPYTCIYYIIYIEICIILYARLG